MVFVILLVGCIATALALPDKFFFLSKGNIGLVLRAIPNLVLIALGVGILMMAGEFDLSVGSVYVAAPFGLAYAYNAGAPLAIAILFALAIAVVIGLVNATITLRFVIPSFITTPGMLFIVRTTAPFLVGYKRSMIVRIPPEIKQIFTGKVFGLIPAQFF